MPAEIVTENRSAPRSNLSEQDDEVVKVGFSHIPLPDHYWLGWEVTLRQSNITEIKAFSWKSR